MSDLLSIISKIKTKPGMYIGQPTITNLFMFLVGYKTARRELGIKPNEQEMIFQKEFQPWLQKRFEVETVNSYAKIISFYTRDEKEAFNYFFDLLDEFFQEKSVSYNQQTLVGDNNQSHLRKQKKITI